MCELVYYAWSSNGITSSVLLNSAYGKAKQHTALFTTDLWWSAVLNWDKPDVTEWGRFHVLQMLQLKLKINIRALRANYVVNQ